MMVGLAIFDFGKKDLVSFGGDDVDFIIQSFVISSDDGVARFF